MDLPSTVWLRRTAASARTSAAVNFWRAVEAQHLVSTLRLTDNDPARQELLERIVDEAKPSLPENTSGLHYLLATPFRYPPRAFGSRFRSCDQPGVLYGAVERRTACAEMGYWRWRFVQDSEGLREIAASPQTLFQGGARGPAVDLQAPPFERHASVWTHPADYAGCQALGLAARSEGVALILYSSVRDPEPGVCVAVLDPAVLRPRTPAAQETWYLTVTSTGAIWQRERRTFAFEFAPVRRRGRR